MAFRKIKIKLKGEMRKMGLDVYVRWEGMTEDERQAQFTGFKNAGEKGYLRQSWGSLEAWNAVFTGVFDRAWDDFINPKWEGYNDEEMVITDESRTLLEESKRVLQEYIDDPKPIDESLKSYFGKEDHITTVVSECKNMVDFISLALNKANSKIIFG